MDFPLRNLNETEKDSLKTCTNSRWFVDWHLSTERCQKKSLARIEGIIKTKTFSEDNDVHYLYVDLVKDDLSGKISTIFDTLGNTAEERVNAATAALKGLNSILPKLNPTYALQFRDSLHDIAVEVAKASGGIFGMGSISEEEKELLNLPMIDKV